MLEVRKSLAKMYQSMRSAADVFAEYGFSLPYFFSVCRCLSRLWT